MDLELDWEEIIMMLGPALLVFLTAFLAFKFFFRQEERKAFHQLRMENRQAVLPVQMQAFERVVLLLERISPTSMINRFQDGEEPLMAAGLHMLMIQTIRQEFDYNLTQQVYLTEEAWNAVKEARTELIQLINQAASETPAQAPASELANQIFSKMVEQDTNPTEEALQRVKKEARRSFLG